MHLRSALSPEKAPVPDELERLRALFAHVHELETVSPFRKAMRRITKGFTASIKQPKPFPMTKPETNRSAA